MNEQDSKQAERLVMQDKLSFLPLREATEPAHRPTHTLPVQLTPLLGREQEKAAVCTLLRREEVRLLTLTGPGGIGKTRLASRVATDMLEDFAGGVYFVSLAPISDPELVMPTIAQSLDLKEVGGQSLADLLKAFLHDKRLLLLLDNFEQVVTAAPGLSELLMIYPELKLLVTSRAVLHLQGEHEFPVPPLAVADLKQLPDLETLSKYASVALFLQRAQAIQPAFQLTENNARAVAEICVRLDGLPLAIELAAARIKLLPPQALLARLGQCLQLLTGGARDAPVRQQTLRNTIEWSYQLLDTQEQRLFRRLSVFAGGFTLEGAEAVSNLSSETELEAISPLDVVASLLDKNFLLQNKQEGDEPRLAMLETIREYGLECLRQSGELEITRQAHANYYLRLSEEVEPELGGPQQAKWLDRLEWEHDNVRVALRWSLERGEVKQDSEEGREIALRFGVALRRFWNIRNHFSEGRAFLERALAVSEGITSAIRVKALIAAASFAVYQGDSERGEVLCRENLALSRERGDIAGTAFSLYLLSCFAWERGQLATSQSLMEESLALEKKLGYTEGIAYDLSYLANLASLQGEYGRAQALFEESLAMDRKLGNKRSIAISLLGVARMLFVSQGESAAVRALLEESLALFREVGDNGGIADGLSLSGLAILQQGDTSTARQLAEESVALSREIGTPYSTAFFLGVLARVEACQGDYTAARADYEEGLAIARKFGYKSHMPFFLEGLANQLATHGEPARAARFWGAAEALRESMGTPIWPIYRAGYEGSVAATRALLEERAFAAAWAEGRTMPLEQTLAAQGPAAQLSTFPVKAPATAPAGLTKREIEVLRLITRGLTDAQIAEELIISRRTVNSHLTSLYSKLQVSSRSAATRYAIEHKLV